MTRVAPPQRSNSGGGSSGSCKSWFSGKSLAFGVGGVLIAAFTVLSSGGGSKSLAEAGGSPKTQQQSKVTMIVDTDIHLSSVTIPVVGDVPFYQCQASSLSPTTNLVLLHGAAFTKEDWKTSGILEKLCASNSKLAVTAMDLPVSADHQQLKQMLDEMITEKIIDRLPVALVTPSASGKTISDWMKTGNMQEIPNYIFKWIPVASGSVKTVAEDKVGSLKSLSQNFSIFAIYGDQDTMGEKVTNYLGTTGGAKTLQLPGRHPVYLDSPDAFVQNILEDLGLL